MESLRSVANHIHTPSLLLLSASATIGVLPYLLKPPQSERFFKLFSCAVLPLLAVKWGIEVIKSHKQKARLEGNARPLSGPLSVGAVNSVFCAFVMAGSAAAIGTCLMHSKYLADPDFATLFLVGPSIAGTIAGELVGGGVSFVCRRFFSSQRSENHLLNQIYQDPTLSSREWGFLVSWKYSASLREARRTAYLMAVLTSLPIGFEHFLPR